MQKAMKINQKKEVLPLALTTNQPSRQQPITLVLRKHAKHTTVKNHQHPYAQLIVCTRGVVQIRTTSLVCNATSQTMVWMPPRHLHHTEIQQDSQLLAVQIQLKDIPIQPLTTPLCSSWRQPRCLYSSPFIHALIQRLIELQATQNSQRYMGQLNQILLTEIEQAPVQPLSVPLPSHPRLRAICQHFLQHPAADQTLTTLLPPYGLSPSTVQRLFKKELNMSWQQWKKLALLAQAVKLNQQNYSLGQIADQLHYSSPSALNHLIKSMTGRSAKLFFLAGT